MNINVTRNSGVFTSIIRRLGVLGVEVKEIVSIDPDGIEHMRYGHYLFYGLTSLGMI